MELTMETLIFLCGMVVFLGISEGSDLTFNTTSPTFQSWVTKTLSLTCAISDSPQTLVGRDLTHTDNDVDYITSMLITKDDQDVAAMSEHVPAQVLGNLPHVNATGKISSSLSQKGYLRVDLTYPHSSDAGEYKCQVTGVDQRGHSFTYFKTLEISEPNNTDFGSQISSMEKLIVNLRTQISSLENQCNALQTSRPLVTQSGYTGSACVSTAHCAGDLECLNGTCGCAVGNYLLDDVTCKQELAFGEHCSKSEQCSGLMQCVHNLCECSEGYEDFNGLCRFQASWHTFIYHGSGVVTSFHWPNYHESSSNYMYVIKASPGQHVNLTFTDIDLSSRVSANNYIYIYDGRYDLLREDYSVIITGKNPVGIMGKSFISTTNIYYLNFVTRASTLGFRLTFTTSS